MKHFKFYLLLTLAIAAMAVAVSSCKKGTDDPAVSIYSRKDRFTNTWTLTKYEKNGAVQDISGATYQYSVFNNGNLTQTIEGTIFGYPTRYVKDGNWVFQNDDEDVKITIGSDATIYNIQRLASKELWLRKTIDADTYVYYFTGL